jgi:hypothetical protein
MLRPPMPAPLQVQKLVLQKLEPLVLVVRAQLALQTAKWCHQCEQ